METSGSEETKQQQKVPQKVHYYSALLSLLVILPSLHINKTPKNKIIPYIYIIPTFEQNSTFVKGC